MRWKQIVIIFLPTGRKMQQIPPWSIIPQNNNIPPKRVYMPLFIVAYRPFFCYLTQVSQVTSGPRRGPTFNNRWWNDRRSWNLRTTNSREKASPKGANHIQSCSCSPPSGTIREYLSLSAGSIPFGHSTRGYSHSPPSGTVECYLRNFN